MYSLASTTWDREEISIATKLLTSGELTMGKEVKGFEEHFAKYIGTKYAVMFNSGSSANLAIFTALKYVKDTKLTEGDHVIVPAVSWSTTFYPINQSGYILDFVDIDPNTLNIDINEVEKRITPKTKAIFTVNLLGNHSDLVALSEIAKKYEGRVTKRSYYNSFKNVVNDICYALYIQTAIDKIREHNSYKKRLETKDHS